MRPRLWKTFLRHLPGLRDWVLVGCVCGLLGAGIPAALAQPAPADTTEAFRSRVNPLLASPRYLWNFIMYPVGEFTLYAEHTRLPSRVLEFFMNDARTFGVFPKVQLGGETGTGGGVKVFHTDLFGRRKMLELGYVYSGERGQMGQFLYHDPSLAGTRSYALLTGDFLRTHNQNSSVNASVRSDSTRAFAINRADAELAVGWRLHAGRLAPTQPLVGFQAFLGYHFQNLRADLGGEGPLTDPGSSRRASLLPGIGRELAYISGGARLVLDNRDYRPPIDTAPHPWLGRLPGEQGFYQGRWYHFTRNTSYPRRGGRLALAARYAAGPDDVRFLKTDAEAQVYLPLLRPGQVLAVRGRAERIFRLDGGFAPYADLVTLGGGAEMRGFRRGFFRGEGSLLFNVEYRYLIWDTWNLFVYWDEGQVFDTFDEVSWEAFHTTVGGGVTIRTASQLVVKFQIGWSYAEKPLLGFTFTQDF